MKHFIVQLITTLTSLLLASSVWAAGLLSPNDGSTPKLNIQSQHVKVVVNDGFATTTVEQVFANPHPQELEATYSFPLPQQAAVGEFSYWIDGNEIVGEVVAKQKAREIYTEQKAAGQDVALAEQNNYRSFNIKVYPVRANSTVKTRLVYLQKLQMDTGTGRYLYPMEEGGTEDAQAASFWHRNDKVEQAFSFEWVLRSAYPVDGLRLPAHPNAVIQQTGPGEWSARIDQQTSNTINDNGQTITNTPNIRLDKDIIVYWRQQQGLPGALDLFTHRPAGQNHGTFMAVLTPAEDLKAVSQGRDWVFVLDISGSMTGKYQTLVNGVRQGMGKLRSNDRFRVVLFNNHARELTRGYTQVSKDSVNHILQTLENTQPGGGTNLYSGLEEGLDDLDADRPTAIILVTDGATNVGVTETKAFRDLLKQQDVRLFSFVMGNGANQPFLQQLSRLSHGFAASVSNSDDIVGQILLATSKLTHASLRDVKLRIKGIKTSEMTPSHFPSVYRGQQLIVFGHYWGDGPADVTLTGSLNGQKKTYSTRVHLPKLATTHPELERLWAFARIGDLLNEQALVGIDADSKQAMVDLALQYSLVTNDTSMIVLREEQFKRYGIQRRNQQRVNTERAARDQRQAQPVSSNRADNSQPMFQGNRPSTGGRSGGGSMSLSLLGLLLMLLAWRRYYGQKS